VDAAPVSKTSSTYGSTAGSACWLCSRSLLASAPASPPYRANTTASMIVDLPEPVGPSSRNTPEAASAAKSIDTSSG
jgi:hypothetical protein